MPVISIIVPVYNSEKYVYRCIDSIINQTYTHFELILIDDGSEDRSGDICDEYAKKDFRIKVIHQKNQGQAIARNKAIQLAKGYYYAFVDSDDYIHPQYLELLITLAQKNDSDVVVCSYIKGKDNIANWDSVNFGDIEYNEYLGSDFYREKALCKSNKIWVLWDKLFKCTCFSNVRFPEGRIYEDNSVIYMILYNSKKIIDTDYKMYYYFENPNSTTNGEFSYRCLDWIKVLEEMISFFKIKKETQLLEFFELSYLENLFSQYTQMLKLYPNTLKTIEMRRKIIRYFRFIKKKYKLNYNNSRVYYKTLFPKTFRFYEYKNKIKKSINRRLKK